MEIYFRTTCLFPDTQDPLTDATIVASAPSRWRTCPSYNHSFGMSENYFIIAEQPLVLDLLGLFTSMIRRKPVSSTLKWYPNEKVRFIVISRSSGKQISEFEYLADPFFVFHHINAFEDSGHLVLDLCCYDDASVIGALDLEVMQEAVKEPKKHPIRDGKLHRYVLPLNPEKVNLKPQSPYIYTGELGYDGPLYDGLLAMTDDMLGPSPMHINYVYLTMHRTDSV